jgi:uncharacterized protein (TIRG00374 family)
MKSWIQFIGLGVSFFFTALVVYYLNWDEVWGALAQIHWGWMILTIVVYYTGVLVRAWRWRWLFPAGIDPSCKSLLGSIMVGQAFNNVLPTGRVGEWLRAAHVAKKQGLQMATAFGTILTERLFDALTLLLLFFASLHWLPPLNGEIQITLGTQVLEGSLLFEFMKKLGVLSLCMLLGIIGLIPKKGRQALFWSLSLLRLPSSWSTWLEKVMKGFIEGLLSVANPWRLLRVLVLSGLMWSINALAAVTLGEGFDELRIDPARAMALVVFQSVATMIPAAPGYWGVYEAGMILGFAMLNLHPSQEVALAYGLIMHLIFFIPTTLTGLWIATKESLYPSTLDSESSPNQATNRS